MSTINLYQKIKSLTLVILSVGFLLVCVPEVNAYTYADAPLGESGEITYTVYSQPYTVNVYDPVVIDMQWFSTSGYYADYRRYFFYFTRTDSTIQNANARIYTTASGKNIIQFHPGAGNWYFYKSCNPEISGDCENLDFTATNWIRGTDWTPTTNPSNPWVLSFEENNVNYTDIFSTVPIYSYGENTFSLNGLSGTFSEGDIVISPQSFSPPPSEDPFYQGVSSNTSTSYLNYVAPKISANYQHEFSFVSLTLPSATEFSTKWFARFQSTNWDKSFIRFNKCGSYFSDCIAWTPPNYTTDNVLLKDLLPFGAEEYDTTRDFQINFPVVDGVTEFYKIELLEYNKADDGTISWEHVHYIPLKIIGDDTSEALNVGDISDYIGTELADYGFYGNILRDLFVPSASFITANVGTISNLRHEKFQSFFQMKDTFDAGLAKMVDSTTKPNIQLSGLYGMSSTNIINVDPIDPYMSQFKFWVASLMWVGVGVFLIRRVSGVINS